MSREKLWRYKTVKTVLCRLRIEELRGLYRAMFGEAPPDTSKRESLIISIGYDMSRDDRNYLLWDADTDFLKSDKD